MSIFHERPLHFCSFYQVILEPTSLLRSRLPRHNQSFNPLTSYVKSIQSIQNQRPLFFALFTFENFIPFSFQEFTAFQRKKLRKLEKKIVFDKSVF